MSTIIAFLLAGALSTAEFCADPIAGGTGEPDFCRHDARVDTPWFSVVVDSQVLIGIDEGGRRILIQFSTNQNQAGLFIHAIPLGEASANSGRLAGVRQLLAGQLSCEPLELAGVEWERCVPDQWEQNYLSRYYFLRTPTDLLYVDHYASRLGREMDPVLLRILDGLTTAGAGPNPGAENASLEAAFPGVPFFKHAALENQDLHIAALARLETPGREYVALTYYQPYAAGLQNRYVSFALLERLGETYEKRLDRVATDDGAGQEFPDPFLYRTGDAALVVFPTCYRGCRYTFFRIDAQPAEVSLAPYEGLGPDESFAGTGDVYAFEETGLIVTAQVARTGDPACCPSGGAVVLSYALDGNTFRVVDVERTE